MVSGEIGRPPVMLRMNAGTSSGFSGLPWARRRTASFSGMMSLLEVTHHGRHRDTERSNLQIYFQQTTDILIQVICSTKAYFQAFEVERSNRKDAFEQSLIV